MIEDHPSFSKAVSLQILSMPNNQFFRVEATSPSLGLATAFEEVIQKEMITEHLNSLAKSTDVGLCRNLKKTRESGESTSCNLQKMKENTHVGNPTNGSAPTNKMMRALRVNYGNPAKRLIPNKTKIMRASIFFHFVENLKIVHM